MLIYTPWSCLKLNLFTLNGALTTKSSISFISGSLSTTIRKENSLNSILFIKTRRTNDSNEAVTIEKTTSNLACLLTLTAVISTSSDSEFIWIQGNARGRKSQTALQQWAKQFSLLKSFSYSTLKKKGQGSISKYLFSPSTYWQI